MKELVEPAADEYIRRTMAAHSGTLRRYLSRRCNPEETEDILQEIWIRFWNRPLDKPFSAGELPWLLRVARNLLVDRYRKTQSENNLRSRYGENLRRGERTKKVALCPEFADLLRSLLDNREQAPEYRLLLEHLLRDRGARTEPIERLLGKSERTVRRMTRKLLSELARGLEENGYTAELLQD